MSSSPLQRAIQQVAAGRTLGADEVGAAFDVVMRGEATAAQIAALLTGLRVRGETAEEVAGVAQALRRAMVQLPAARPEELVDTCGTGGGTVQTFNISTAAALLAAGAGVRIAKHGNRSFTSRSGSADVLEALGVAIDAPLEVMGRALDTAGIVFMFAPLMHPAMRHVGPVRRELAIHTVMNIVGPLANPACAGRQVIGVAEEQRVALMASALAMLGTRHALVVHGAPGMDEVSPLGPTRVVEVREGALREWTIDPADYGFGGVRAEELAGGEPEANAQLIGQILRGAGSRGAQAAVVLNAAAALYVAGPTRSFGACVEAADAALRSGAGLAALDRLRTAFRAAAPRP